MDARRGLTPPFYSEEIIMSYKVEGITHRGEGVIRVAGKAVFVPFTIPGEQIQVLIERSKKKYARGIVTDILEASADRVDPLCPHYYQCGGCAYQHMTYRRELALKRQVVEDNLYRLGKLSLPVNDVIGMKYPWHYRNKVTWHVGTRKAQPRLGYYRSNSRSHLPILECYLLSPEMTRLSQFVDCYLAGIGMENGKKLIIRQGTDQKLMLIAEGPLNRSELISLVKGYPHLESVFVYENQQLSCLYGNPYLKHEIGDRQYQVSPLAFFQVNHEQTEKLYDLVKNAAADQEGKVILDAYCGTGSIALYLAPQHRRIIGIEAHAESIADAKINAQLNQLTHCEFQQGACEKLIKNIDTEIDTIILDPPRTGCHRDLLQQIAEKGIKQIVYVSCHPSTLARDIKILSEQSYQVQWVQPIDMFPRTHHVECVTLMSKVEK